MNPLTPPEQTLLDMALDCARQEFDEIGSAGPVLMAIRNGNEIALCPLDGIQKGEVSGIVNQIKHVVPCVLILEAWQTTVDKEKSPALFDAAKDGDTSMILPPRTDPARREAVMVQLYHKDRHILTHAPITRPKTGKPTLGEWGHRFDNTDTQSGVAHRTSFRSEGYLRSGDIK